MKKKGNRTVKDLFDKVFTKDCDELDDRAYYYAEDVIETELGEIEMDDLMITAFASINPSEDEPATIHGRLRFCVYGGVPYSEIAEKLRAVKSDFLRITDVWHPEQTPGVSFNGVYENEDTTYVGARYQIRLNKEER